VGEEVKRSMEWLIKRLIKVGAKVSYHGRRWYVHYYVSSLRQERQWALRFTAGTEQHERSREIADYLRPMSDEVERTLTDKAALDLQAINSVLSKEPWLTVNCEFEKHIDRNNLKYEPHWHEPLGFPSLATIAKEVRKTPEYQVFYAEFSKLAHTGDYRNHISFSKGCVHFQPIRYAESIVRVCVPTIARVLTSYRVILSAYMPAELANFKRTYKSKWRDRYSRLQNKRVQYKKVSVPL
jgi:hypothetical protein